MQDVFHNLCLGYMHSMLHHSSNSLGISTAFMQEVNRSTHLHDTVQLDARETPALALPSTREHAEVQQRIQQLPLSNTNHNPRVIPHRHTTAAGEQ